MAADSKGDATKPRSIEDLAYRAMAATLNTPAPDGEPERNSVVLLVSATSAEIAGWLSTYKTSDLNQPNVPGWQLQYATFKPAPQSNRLIDVLVHSVCLITHAESPDLAREGVLDLGNGPFGRILVELEQWSNGDTFATVAWDPEIKHWCRDYLAHLIIDMDERFPAKEERWRISRQVGEQMRESTEHTASAADEQAPTAPERKTEAEPATPARSEESQDTGAPSTTVEAPQKQVSFTLPKGKRLLDWRRIYDEIAKRPRWKWTYQGLSSWLFKMHPNLSSRKGKPLSRDTLSNIVGAGKNGLLDNIKITER